MIRSFSSVCCLLLLAACGDITVPPSGNPCPTGQSSTTLLIHPAAGTPPPELMSQCLEDPVVRDAAGDAACIVIASRAGEGACSCAAEEGLSAIAENHKGVLDIVKSDPAAGSWDCFCEVTALKADAGLACRSEAKDPVVDAQGKPLHGFCYVDPLADSTSNPALTEACPAAERRAIRFTGTSATAPAAKDKGLTIVCATGGCAQGDA